MTMRSGTSGKWLMKYLRPSWSASKCCSRLLPSRSLGINKGAHAHAKTFSSRQLAAFERLALDLLGLMGGLQSRNLRAYREADLFI
mmetsp:Transcript_107795/g.300497  ORF Transcript_107795/g.300497 Transcript_107795/m.300497 type:complete len:86 (+) Transcript_107795:1319-1576(+)